MTSRASTTKSYHSRASLTELVLATTNLHKVRELRAFLKPLHRFEVYSLADFPHYSPPEESGQTFEENAVLKATHAAHSLNRWTLADDSGLVVPALKGAPGVYSARYAGEGASDKDNRKKLLDEMAPLEDFARSAYFECVIALASPEGVKKCVHGTCEGMIAQQEKGGNGFGYDPLFIKEGYHLTFGQLDEQIKNQISHRAKALAKMLLVLESL